MSSKRKRGKPKEEYAFIEAKVVDYEVRSVASVNPDLHQSRPLFSRSDDPAFEFITTIEIMATCVEPSDRAGDVLQITLYGNDSNGRESTVTLEDYQLRDEYGVPEWKTIRGERYPVYEAPPGLSVLNKQRGERAWNAWLFVTPWFVSDVLVLLGQSKQLFLSVHEKMSDRKRWIQSLSVQTADPGSE